MAHLAAPLLALFLMLVGLVSPPAHAQERRVALVIGNTSYQHATRLPNAVNDADAMARTLGAMGFAATRLPDQDAAGMRRALRDFSDASRGASVALFFFAGHGLQAGQRDRAENFLVPTDARLADERDLEDETIPLSRVLTLMEGARTRIVILDACRDNPLARRMARPGATRNIGRGLARIDDDRAGGTLVAFSTAPGTVAEDGRGRNSPFTEALVRHLPTPGLEVQPMFTRVRAEVARATNNTQIPWTNTALLEEVFLAGLPSGNVAAARPAPVAPPAPTQPAVGVSPEGSGYPVAVGQAFRDCPDCPEMVVIPAGSFVMGSPPGEEGRFDEEGPQRTVRLSHPLAVGRFEVTFGEWNACFASGRCGDRRGAGRRREGERASLPVDQVSWHDAQDYVRWLSARTGQTYRLLTEAEWEYAARGGTTTPWHTGMSISRSQANFGAQWQVADFQRRIYQQPVGSYAANRFGLHDMAGNLREWVQDCFDTYAGAPTDASLAVLTGDCCCCPRKNGQVRLSGWHG